jgi:HlyD family secretion protein
MELQAKKGYQIGIKWLVFSSLISAVSFGGYAAYNYYQARPEEALEVRLATVEKGTIKISVNATGTVQLGNQQVIKSPGEGTVEEVFVRVGDSIFQGDELMRLRNRETDNAIIQYQLDTRIQEIELEGKRRTLENAELAVTEKREEIERIRAELKEPRQQKALRDLEFNIRDQKLTLEENRQAIINAELNLEEIQQEIDIDNQLLEKGLIARDILLEKKRRLREQRTTLRNTKNTLERSKMQLEEYQLQYQDIQRQIQDEIEDVEDSLREAESQLREAESELRTAKEDLIKHDIDVRKKELEYQQSLQKIQDSTIISPINGKVLSIQVKAGDGLEIGNGLLAVGNQNIELVELNLSTLDAPKVEPNQLALVTLIGPEPEPIPGRVENISLQAGGGSGESSGSSSGVATVGATVRLDNPVGLIPGTTVNVEIILERAEDVPALEIDLVRREDDRDFVWVRDSEGNARKQTVTLGLEDGIKVEITSGLNVDDKAIVPPLGEKLEPGRAIAPIESEEN